MKTNQPVCMEQKHRWLNWGSLGPTCLLKFPPTETTPAGAQHGDGHRSHVAETTPAEGGPAPVVQSCLG